MRIVQEIIDIRFSYISEMLSVLEFERVCVLPRCWKSNLNVGKISFRVHVGITTMLEKQPKFLSVGKILSFRVHVGITTVLEKQPKFLSVGKNIIPSSCRNFLECENRIGNGY